MAHKYAKRPFIAHYDALQMPIQQEHEAAKDYEVRVSAFCMWLDEKGFEVTDIQLVPEPSVTAKDDSDDETKFTPGMWLVTSPPLNKGYHVERDEDFQAHFIEVNA